VSSLRILTGNPPAPAAPCEVPDNGSGTASLPPAGCEYEGDTSGGSNDKYVITEGLPPGTTIEIVPIHKDFICNPDPSFICSVPVPPGVCEVPGGGLGGNIACADSAVELQVTGTGAPAGFNRTLSVPTSWEAHSGPRNPGDPVQSFPTEMVQLDGAIFGDPDFDLLRIRAGSFYGLPSPGGTTLTERAAGDYQVDSFFDVVYTIDYQGAPGGQLDGLSGTTQGSLRMETGNPQPILEVPSVRSSWLFAFAVLLVVAGLVVSRRVRSESV